MKLMQLLHLKVSQRTNVLQQRQSVPRAEPAQSAMIQLGLGWDIRACLEQVAKEQRRGLVPRRGCVQRQFVRTVRVIVTRVTT